MKNYTDARAVPDQIKFGPGDGMCGGDTYIKMDKINQLNKNIQHIYIWGLHGPSGVYVDPLQSARTPNLHYLLYIFGNHEAVTQGMKDRNS